MTSIKLTEEEMIVLSHCPGVKDEEGNTWKYLVPFFYREDQYGQLTCWKVDELPNTIKIPTERD